MTWGIWGEGQEQAGLLSDFLVSFSKAWIKNGEGWQGNADCILLSLSFRASEACRGADGPRVKVLPFLKSCRVALPF